MQLQLARETHGRRCRGRLDRMGFRARSACHRACLASLLIVPIQLRGQDPPVGPLDVIELPTITDARLSPDGRRVIYAVRARDIDANSDTHSFWLWTAGAAHVSLPIDERASRLRWRPDGTALSYLAPDSAGATQVWEYRLSVGAQRLTSRPRSVLSYEWSPDGQYLALLASRFIVAREASGAAGVIIDNDRFFFTRLLANKPLQEYDSHYGEPPTRTELWIYDVEAGHAELASDTLSVSTYAWSPDSRRLAMTAHGRLSRLPSHLARHDLLLYRLDDRKLNVLESGSGGDYYDDTVSYDQPFWSPDGTCVGYFRKDLRERWDASPQLGAFSLSNQRTVLFLDDEELELYEPRPFWLHPDTILIENTYRAGRRLFTVALADASVAAALDTDDWRDRHSFSRDGRLMAFIRERIDTPGDLHLSDRSGSESRQLTELAARLDDVRTPRVKRIRWPGGDGADVEGWLYLPFGDPPFPTIVFIHGGPTWVFANRYEPYVSVWPHAFSTYAARGMAVFVPNYRGTGSYGKGFRRSAALDAEPLTDIVSGLDMLIRQGVADEGRLGIAGHSHGCWLGALVAVRHRRFAAGACAEGAGNMASSYERNAGWLNSEIIEHYWGAGASPYTEPERYRDSSPVYGFGGLQTPFLFEAGEHSAMALSAVEYATASWRAGVPHELVIYRGTHHNVSEPRVMLEVMERNLEWFEFWLLGRRQTTDDAKRAQYERWRALREDVR